MGFWKNLFGIGIKDNSKDLIGSIILELDKMQQRAIKIGIALSKEKKEELEEKIEDFRDKIKNDEVTEKELQESFQVFKQEFEQELKKLGNKYLFQELDLLNKKLYKRCFEGSTQEEPYGYLESIFESLCNKENEFTGTKRELYKRELIKAKYRIALYGMQVEKIEESSEQERVIFATFLTEDIQTMYDYISKIKYKYYLESEECEYLIKLEKRIDGLVRRMEIEYAKTDSFVELLKDYCFLKDLINTVTYIRRCYENIESDIQIIKKNREDEQVRSKAEEEAIKIAEQEEVDRKIKEEEQRQKDMEISFEEMSKIIKEIDDDSFDVTDSYKEIMEYEKRIAKVRGLSNKKNEMATDDLTIIRIQKDEVGICILNAEEQNIPYTILCDVDDSECNCIIVMSKKDIDKLNIEIEDNGLDSLIGMRHVGGTYGKPFVFFCKDRDDSIIFYEKKAYVKNEKTEGNKIKQCIRQIRNLDKLDYIENVKFYIEMPYLRCIIPVLEKLKEEQIDYYIPPIDEELKKTEPVVRIYIDRCNLEKYKNNVHSLISNAESGIIRICGENMKMSQIMLEGTDCPYIDVDKEKEKE